MFWTTCIAIRLTQHRRELSGIDSEALDVENEDSDDGEPGVEGVDHRTMEVWKLRLANSLAHKKGVALFLQSANPSQVYQMRYIAFINCDQISLENPKDAGTEALGPGLSTPPTSIHPGSTTSSTSFHEIHLTGPADNNAGNTLSTPPDRSTAQTHARASAAQ